MNWNQVDDVVSSFLGDGKQSGRGYPGAVLLVGRGENALYHKAYGFRALEPKMELNHEQVVYDIATLTESLLTTTLLMRAVATKKIDLTKKISNVVHTFGTHGKDKITVRHLLNHTSGLIKEPKFFSMIEHENRASRAGIMASRGAVELVYQEISRSRPDRAPGERFVSTVSDFILLGAVLEILYGGVHFEKIARRELIGPLGLKSFGMIEIARLKRGGLAPVTEMIASAGYCPKRKRTICGEVWDRNAWAMGGVSGHAGIFSSAHDLKVMLAELIKCADGRGSFLPAQVVREFWQTEDIAAQSHFGYGWETGRRFGKDTSPRICGEQFSENSVGRVCEKTGCAVWVEPAEQFYVVFLANRSHLGSEAVEAKKFIPAILDAVFEQATR